jgi:predicted transcriptional regulator
MAKRPPVRKPHQKGVRLDDELLARLEAIAVAEDRPVSWVMRTLLDEALAARAKR